MTIAAVVPIVPASCLSPPAPLPGTPPSAPGRKVLRICVPVALPDDLLVDQQVVALAEDVGLQPAIPVPAGRAGLDFQPHALAPEQAGRERERGHSQSSPVTGQTNPYLVRLTMMTLAGSTSDRAKASRGPIRCQESITCTLMQQSRVAVPGTLSRPSAVCSRIAYSDQKRPWCSYLLPAGEGAPQGRMRAELLALARKSPHPAVPATFSPREKERMPRRACNSMVKRPNTLSRTKRNRVCGAPGRAQDICGARADLGGFAEGERFGAVDRGHGSAHRLHRPGATGTEARARSRQAASARRPQLQPGRFQETPPIPLRQGNGPERQPAAGLSPAGLAHVRITTRPPELSPFCEF